mmetsp:Transcript_14376/g.49737  ORF Transcript_14376/g.49737 Transcript_14376/m.49737 type:complete len:229 (-) Transcript_14376:1081-1767(-)
MAVRSGHVAQVVHHRSLAALLDSRRSQKRLADGLGQSTTLVRRSVFLERLHKAFQRGRLTRPLRNGAVHGLGALRREHAQRPVRRYPPRRKLLSLFVKPAEPSERIFRSLHARSSGALRRYKIDERPPLSVERVNRAFVRGLGQAPEKPGGFLKAAATRYAQRLDVRVKVLPDVVNAQEVRRRSWPDQKNRTRHRRVRVGINYGRRRPKRALKGAEHPRKRHRVFAEQ